MKLFVMRRTPQKVMYLSVVSVCLVCSLNYFFSTLDLTETLGRGEPVFDMVDIPCDVRNKNFEVLLASPGGTGSSSGFGFFVDTLGVRSTKMNNEVDADGLKHKPYTSLIKTMLKCNLHSKVIVYQFSDPVDAVYSLYRRQFAYQHFIKLESNFQIQHTDLSILTNVSRYAQSGKDLFGFRRHIESYFLEASHSTIPVIFMNTKARSNTDIVLKLVTILNIFDVNVNVNVSQSTRAAAIVKSSTSKYRNESGFDQLSNTYAPLNSFLNNLGNLSVVHRGFFTRWA